MNKESVKVKVKIVEDESLKIDQEIELKTQGQKERYEQLYKKIQDFLTSVFYENAGMT